MKILNINSTNYLRQVSTNVKKNESPSSEIETQKPSQLAFCAGYNSLHTASFRRAVLTNEQTNAVYNRVFSLLKKLPNNSKMSKPNFIDFGEERFGYIIDKTLPNRLSVKVMKNVKNVEDWNNPNVNKTTLKCVFNERGVLEVGELIETKDGVDSLKALCQQCNSHGRRVIINGVIYRPIVGNAEEWKIIKTMNAKCGQGKEKLSEKLKKTEMSDLFMELAKNRTSVLL